jgi:hypothetical protein
MFETSIVDVEQIYKGVTKLPIYAYDDTTQIFLPISNFSYNFQLIFEKYNSNWITHKLSSRILNCIARMHNENNSRRYRHFAEYDYTLKEESNTIFKLLHNTVRDLFDPYYNLCSARILYIDLYKIPVYVVLLEVNNDIEIVICSLHKNCILSNDDIFYIQKHAISSFISYKLPERDMDLLKKKYPHLSYYIKIQRFLKNL